MECNIGYNPEKQMMTFTFVSNLFFKYYSNFQGLISNDSEIPGAIVKREKLNQVTVLVPVDIEKTGKASSGPVLVKSNSPNIINSIVNYFINSAVEKELSITEFIPLKGYPISNLQLEILDTIKNKRNLCIVKTYLDYQNYVNFENNYDFEQYLIEYGSDEWCDAVIFIKNGELKKLEKLTAPKLNKVSWL